MRDPHLVRIELVDHLPAACGGGAACTDGDGVLWVLLDRKHEPPVSPELDMVEWTNVGYDLVDNGEIATCANMARILGADLECAQAAWWSYAWEWCQLRFTHAS